MRFRLGLVTGLATGYYLGARAGRQRYDQINRSLDKLRRSEAFEQATERAKSVAEEAVEKAKETVDQLVGDKATVDQLVDHTSDVDQLVDHTSDVDQRAGSAANGHGAESDPAAPNQATAGIILPTDPPTGLGGYSSSR